MKWWNLFTRAWYLIGKHAAIDLQETVECQICGQVYESYGEGEIDGTKKIMQGHDLCAWSWKLPDGRWVIHCGYGSDFDLSEFWYIDQFPTKPVDGICDWCIRRMLRDGIIIDSGHRTTLDYNGYSD